MIADIFEEEEMNCDYCGCLLPKEYTPNCKRCGAARSRPKQHPSFFRGLEIDWTKPLPPDLMLINPRPLPMLEVTKGQKPLPKPLPPLRRLQPDYDLIYTYDWGWKITDAIIVIGLALCVALPLGAILWTLLGS